MSTELKDGDYTLADGNAWLTVGNVSIRISATDQGVVCDMYRRGDEMSDAIASCYVFNTECEVD
jgi:hypothetical protein